MDEYNINNIEKINSINFININNENLTHDPQQQLYNKIKYFKSLNNTNSFNIQKKSKNIYKGSNNNLNNDTELQDRYIEASIQNLNCLQRYNNEDISADYEMNRANIPEMKINSKKYEGLKKKSRIINTNNSINFNNKLNLMNPTEQIRYNDNMNNYTKYRVKNIDSEDIINKSKYISNKNYNSIKNMPKNNTYKTLHNNVNNDVNKLLNNYTDYSMDESTTSQNSKVNLYIKRINEYKKRNQQLVEKINLLINNLKVKTKENQNLIQKNQILQNELNFIKTNNEQKNNMTINNNDELKKVLMQKNKMIKEVYQKMQKMKKEIDNISSKNTNLSQILTKKNLELVDQQKELIEKDKKIEQLTFALNQEKSDEENKNEKLNLINEELKKENDNKEIQIEALSKKINDLEIDLKGVKNNEKEYFFENKKNMELVEKKEKEIKKLKEQISSNKNALDKISKDNQNKESEILLKRIEDLTNENNKLTKHINTLTLKNAIENWDITPDNYEIIGNKCHKKLIWYLLYKKSSSPETKHDSNDYNNYIWVKEPEIKKLDLKTFNKFEDEGSKINELKDYIVNLQKKLEIKEEKINKLDYKNQKLSSQLHNKTANIKGNIVLNKQSKDISNMGNSFNTEAAENEKKYQKILEKLNDSNKRNIHLHNQVIILKEKLNEKDNLEKKFPHDMKDIDPKLQDSGFLDDDSFENKERDINNLFNKEELNDYIENKDNEELIKENNDKNISNNSNNENDLNKAIDSKNDPFKESERKVDEFLAKGAGEEDDFDEVKMINKQMNFLKEEIKDYREKLIKLGSEIKELFSKIKCNDKNRKNIIQICQILSFSPNIIDQIITNKYKIGDKGGKK